MSDLKLNIGASGTEYFFTENEKLLEYLGDRYPMLNFIPTLSITQYEGMNTIHPLPVKCYISEGLTFNSPEVQNSVIDALVQYLDNVAHSMNRAGIKSATVHMSRVELQGKTGANSLKPELTGKLRAVFIQDKDS